jgi:uncharacterized protein (DUF2237 family)
MGRRDGLVLADHNPWATTQGRSYALIQPAQPTQPRNVLGGPLAGCCSDPLTGFYRNGRCETGPDDLGVHTVCAQVTEDFLSYTASRGNDLSTPHPGFPGLKPGDRWCLCAARWLEAQQAGAAPPVMLRATHEATLKLIPLELLERYAADESGAE